MLPDLFDRPLPRGLEHGACRAYRVRLECFPCEFLFARLARGPVPVLERVGGYSHLLTRRWVIAGKEPWLFRLGCFLPLRATCPGPCPFCRCGTRTTPRACRPSPAAFCPPLPRGSLGEATSVYFRRLFSGSAIRSRGSASAHAAQRRLSCVWPFGCSALCCCPQRGHGHVVRPIACSLRSSWWWPSTDGLGTSGDMPRSRISVSLSATLWNSSAVPARESHSPECPYSSNG